MNAWVRSAHLSNMEGEPPRRDLKETRGAGWICPVRISTSNSQEVLRRQNLAWIQWCEGLGTKDPGRTSV
ncbi:unnamed protein product, partial [Ilex paraguariensis]